MRNIRFVSIAFIFVVALFIQTPSVLFADTRYTNPDTGKQALIQDEADLLSDSDEESLLSLMESITSYYDVGVVTISYNDYGNTYTYTQKSNESLFDNGNSVLFVIDMDEREIVLDGMNDAGKVITKAVANTITDNIYTYATDGDYYTCCYKAMTQVLAKLEGRRINQPMKYISNALLALILAMLINYLAVMLFSKKHKPSKSELFSGIFSQVKVNNAQATFVNQTKTYSPQSSGSSGGGGSRSSGGGGGHSSSSHSSGGHHF